MIFHTAYMESWQSYVMTFCIERGKNMKRSNLIKGVLLAVILLAVFLVPDRKSVV